MVKLLYRKLYADLVTADGTVCIVYVTRLDVGMFAQRSAGYELYTPDGQRAVVHATGPARVDFARDAIRIELPVAHGQLELIYRLTGPTSADSQHVPTDGLSWKVLVFRSEASMRVPVAPGFERALDGWGYADEVVIEKAPRALGLRRIRWGRAHVDGASLVFNRITLGSGKTWQVASDGERWSHDLDLVDASHGLSAVEHAGKRLTIDEGRVLHRGGAIDRSRFRAPLQRYLARALTGCIAENRRLSTVVDARGVSGFALHEDVSLG